MSEEGRGQTLDDPGQSGQWENFYRIIFYIFPVPAERALRQDNYGVNSSERKNELLLFREVVTADFFIYLLIKVSEYSHFEISLSYEIVCTTF